MPEALKTTVTELPESRVRVEAEVPAAEVEKSLARAAKQLARDMRVPGFRQGKIPAQVVIRRVGRPYVLDEAIRSSINGWYSQAVDAAKIHPVGEPDVDLGDMPEQGQPLSFSVEIGVRPVATLGDYKGLEVGRREAVADDHRVEHELEHLREHLARLETAEREAREGDFVVADYVGSIDGVNFEGGEGRDQLIELGAGRLIPGFEEQLAGARAGEDRIINVTFPADYGADHLAGREAQFALTVKEVRERVLPEIDDDLASDAAGFDTLDELKDDIRRRIVEQDGQAIENEFREAVLDAVVAQATVDVPDALTEARARELWDQTALTLAQRGISREAYLQMSGRSEEEILEEAKPDAEQALKRDAVLAAIVVAEQIEPSDEELAAALEHTASHERTTGAKLLERVKKQGNVDALKEDVATTKALDLIVEAATPVAKADDEPADADDAAARRAPARRAARARAAARRAPARRAARARARRAARADD
ncbi:trigger factor [Conexibacter sp. JD483]|uniref:trigger factor n=1 Tax=unclassified Conexibacter TaxID=2627773 RepID=UPI0027271690|nr:MULTISPECIES: trigger factor [unclassified Conexibacter]MDO8187641.1 trigger factor [Conexibacter sp. CPCC 205706]MDO8201027.1 trigger factor [Conexibacter sp. CPCC 205762]MDR9371200.1 trigger factor [Conexibacter sp. JD483]